MKPFLQGLSICWLMVTNLMFLTTIIIASMHNGKVLIDFNQFHELYLEAILSFIVIFTYPFWYKLSVAKSLEKNK